MKLPSECHRGLFHPAIPDCLRSVPALDAEDDFVRRSAKSFLP